MTVFLSVTKKLQKQFSFSKIFQKRAFYENIFRRGGVEFNSSSPLPFFKQQKFIKNNCGNFTSENVLTIKGSVHEKLKAYNEK